MYPLGFVDYDSLSQYHEPTVNKKLSKIMKKSEFARFVDWAGSQALAAERLKVSRSLINYIVLGRRHISPQMAHDIQVVSGGRFKREVLVFEGRDL